VWGEDGADDEPFGSHPLDRVILWGRRVGVVSGLEGPEGTGVVHPSACKNALGRGLYDCPANAPRSRWRVGSVGRLPPQDFVLLGTAAHQYDPLVHFPKQIWFANFLALAAQPGARVLPPDVGRAYNASHLLCSRRGGVVGSKPRIFSGRSDAYLFRNMAYLRAGVVESSHALKKSYGIAATPFEQLVRGRLTIPSAPVFVPRTVTIITRKWHASRSIHNIEAVVEAVTGALGADAPPPQVVIFDPDFTPWEEHVQAMASTGILVASHGAALANLVFLPTGAAVIEIFPWKFHKTTYRSLATSLGLMYLPIHAQSPPDPTDLTVNRFAGDCIYRRKFYDACIATYASAFQFNNNYLCLEAVKHQNIVVDIPALRNALDQAIDHIGAYALSNPFYAPHLNRDAFRPPIPTYEEWVALRPREAMEGVTGCSD